jgi:spermidine synthase
MTDFYDEWWTQRDGIGEALDRGGDVLITGLGLGLIAEAMLRPVQSRVQRITIVEYSSDVIQLVAPHLHSHYPGKIEIIQADAFTWEPHREQRFTVGWHDIWPDPHTPANAEDMKRLEEHYRPWCDWQGFWPKTYQEAVAGR